MKGMEIEDVVKERRRSVREAHSRTYYCYVVETGRSMP